MDCTRCELRARCHSVTWGKGPAGASLMVIGECSNTEDELLGEPFMSRPGKLIRKLLGDAGFPPNECYLTLAVKCIADATSIEAKQAAKQCRYWLNKEVLGVKPKAIVTLGMLPTSVLLNLKSSQPLSSVLGQRQEVASIAVYPWYSVSRLVNGGKKSDAETVKFLKRIQEGFNVSTTA